MEAGQFNNNEQGLMKADNQSPAIHNPKCDAMWQTGRELHSLVTKRFQNTKQ